MLATFRSIVHHCRLTRRASIKVDSNASDDQATKPKGLLHITRMNGLFSVDRPIHIRRNLQSKNQETSVQDMRTTSAASRAIRKNETMESDSDNSGSSYAEYHLLPASVGSYTRRFEQGHMVDTVDAVKEFYRPCSRRS